ncbi:acidic leucine-rich nuclear phosphoprotein 32 family member B-like [Argopecten irradians]|uniref:acidic leucine-rich nuclear phosphoprotein 32 family member B-like n=1 Tax=Argopecten irradians TaxID=31199 RepID=UPI0037245ED7
MEDNDPYQDDSDEEVTLEVTPKSVVDPQVTLEEYEDHQDDDDAPMSTGDDQLLEDEEDGRSQHPPSEEEEQDQESDVQEETNEDAEVQHPPSEEEPEGDLDLDEATSRPRRTRMQPKWMQSGQYVLSQQPDWVSRANYIRSLARSGEFQNAQSDLTRALLKVITDNDAD